MKKIIETCEGDGLPISCIANLCYLPEYVNRSKKDKNFYQDIKYLTYIDLPKVEAKYSFTESEDLEWMDMPYEQAQDFAVLKEYYTEFCTKRFDKIKHLFCEALGIDYEVVEPEVQFVQRVVARDKDIPKGSNVKFGDKCIQRYVEDTQHELLKIGRSTYAANDNTEGIIVTTSKAYKQGDREKYWFAYRKKPLEDIKQCRDKYVLYGCKDESIPVEEIEKRLDTLNYSKDEDGNISHWHMVFYRNNEGRVTWMLSKPENVEIDVTEYLLK